MKTKGKKVLSVILSAIMLFSALPFGAVTASADDLSDAKAAFVSRVNEMYNGTKYYKNVMPAYLAYLEACKSTAGSAEATALTGAMAGMTEFNSYTANATVSINGVDASRGKHNGSGTADEKCYSNVIYTQPRSQNIQYSELGHASLYWSNGILTYRDELFIYQPGAVVLYDGKTDAKIPVLFAEQENNGNYSFRYAYVIEAGGRLIDYWKGRNRATKDGKSTLVDIVWPENVDYYIPNVSGTNDYWDSFDDSSSAGGHKQNSDFYNFSNSLVFDIDGGKDYTTVTNKSEYRGIPNYKKISKIEWNVKAFWGNLLTGNEHIGEGDLPIYTNNPVYVINYKKLLDKISLTMSEKKDTYINLSDSAVKESFDNGNAVGFFGAFDTAFGLDVTDMTKFNYADGTEDAVISAATAINDACVDLDEISSTAAAMSSIVNNITKYEAMMKDNPYRYNLAVTYEWYLKAKECFDAYVFGQMNDPEQHSEFLTYLSTVANGFERAITESLPYATYTGSGDNKTFTASPIEGNYTPEEDQKIFEGDTNAGTTGLATYTNSGAMTNVLYYPSVTRNNGVRAETDTEGGSNHSWSVDGRTMPFNGDGDGTNHFTIYYPSEIVLSYNGTDAPSFPVLSTIRNAHSSGGVENFSTAAYPTDSTTLLSLSSRFLGEAQGYHTQKVNGISYGDGYYPFATKGVDTASNGYYNVESSTKGPHAPAESAAFNIKTFSSYYYYDGQTATNKKYWKGIWTENDKNNLPLNWIDSWNTAADGLSGTGAMYGSPTEWWSRYYDIKADDNHDKAEIATAASALELVVNPFSGMTASDGAEYYTKEYNGPNWYHSWQESRWGGVDLNVEVMLDKGTSKIRVLNVIPAQEAKQRLLNSTPTQDILGAIFQYDKDSADVVKFLSALDEIGSFDPNNSKYDYSAATSGTPVYSENKGIEDCCKDMALLAGKVTTALNYIDNSTTSDESTVNDDKVNLPTDAASTSTNTTDLGDGWYDNLRKALLDPLEADACTDTESVYYTTYMDALDTAQAAVSYSATSKIAGGSGADYESTYNSKTIEQIAQELLDAAANFDKANTKHTYLYEAEDEDQISEWECESNAMHTHSNADMSVYNELDIAYNTIDHEAYKNFEEELGNVYDDKNAGNENTSYVEVKTKSTRLAPQTYVDGEIAELLTAINTVAEDSEKLESYTTHFYICIDGDETPDWIADYTWEYGTVASFNAADYVPAGATCYKWTVQQGAGAVQTIFNKSNTLSNFVQGEATVIAYVNSASAEGATVVSVYGPTNSVIEEFNALKTDSVTFGTASDGSVTVTIGGKAHTIKSTTSYNVTGITVGSMTNETSYDGQSFASVNALLEAANLKTLSIYPKVTNIVPDTTTYTVTAGGANTASALTNFKSGATASAAAGETSTLAEVKYDEKVRVEYTPNTEMGDFWGIVINESVMTGNPKPHYVPITYSNMYDFRACSEMGFYPLYRQSVTVGDTTAYTYIVDDGNGTKITDREDRFYISRKLPFVINFMDKTNVDGKFIFRAVITAGLPDSVNITEHGWVYYFSTNSTAVNAIGPGERDIVIGNSLRGTDETTGTEYTGTIVKQAASKTLDSVTHQYSFSNKNRTSYAYLLARGYVKFTYTFEHDDSSAPIEAISYGRADYYRHD